MRFLPFLGLMFFSVFSQAEIYKWVDENGKIHFGDKPRQQKAVNAQKVQIQTSPSSWQPLNIQVLYRGSLEHTLTNEHELDRQRIQREVNWVYRFYDEILYFDFYKKVPVKINVLRDMQEYHDYVFKISGFSAKNSLGVYLPSLHEIAVFIHPEKLDGKEGTYRTIKHEASHAIIGSLAELIPAWLNEGMAEQMEYMTHQDGKFIIPHHKRNRRSVLRSRQRLMAVDRFIEIDSRRWRKAQANGVPTQGVAGQLVYLSLSKSYGRSFITRLLQDYKRGERKRSFYLLDEHYIGGTSAFKLHWQTWLNSDMKEPAAIYFP
ncbi:MAG: DUF4124 domain-containing protein [Saccharospirillaceae bacterium]|nr:hypothetical protein A3759_07805 [Thalassolituus sp. HI0120]MCH2040144.1 DUF4124 domain-containing protein [Saccharospirillaceae bacterium]